MGPLRSSDSPPSSGVSLRREKAWLAPGQDVSPSAPEALGDQLTDLLASTMEEVVAGG